MLRSGIAEGTGRLRGGFGIVEAMVALLMFGAFIAGACNLILVSRESVARATDNYTAITLAHARLERLQTYSFDQLVDMAQTNDPSQVNQLMDEYGNPTTLLDLAKYRMSTEVSIVKSNLVMVTVTTDIKSRVILDFDGKNQYLTTMLSDQQEAL